MAASKQLQEEEDNLCCYICLETYDNPRILPCSHSFCHICLVGYANTAIDGKGKLDFHCPICRGDAILNGKRIENVEKWVESLPINFTLILNVVGRKNQKPGSHCEQCFRDAVEVPATVYCYECSEYLCNNCRDVHKKVKASFSHKLCDIGESDETVAKLKFLKSLTRCSKHKSEKIRYVCIDHDELCCTECAVLTHRKCTEVVPVLKVVDTMKTSVQERHYRLTELSKCLNTLSEYETKQKSTITVCKDEMKDTLKNIKKQFDEAFHEMEQAITGEFEAKIESILKESALCRQEVKTLEADVNNLRRIFEIGQPLHRFLAERILQKEIKEQEDMVKRIHKKMSIDIVRVVEQVKFNEIEKYVADCLRITVQAKSVNVPMYPETLKYRSWREAVKTTEKVVSIPNPDTFQGTTFDISPEQNIGPDVHEEPSNDYNAKQDFVDLSSEEDTWEDTSLSSINAYDCGARDVDFVLQSSDFGLSKRQRKQIKRKVTKK